MWHALTWKKYSFLAGSSSRPSTSVRRFACKMSASVSIPWGHEKPFINTSKNKHNIISVSHHACYLAIHFLKTCILLMNERTESSVYATSLSQGLLAVHLGTSQESSETERKRNQHTEHQSLLEYHTSALSLSAQQSMLLQCPSLLTFALSPITSVAFCLLVKTSGTSLVTKETNSSSFP